MADPVAAVRGLPCVTCGRNCAAHVMAAGSQRSYRAAKRYHAWAPNPKDLDGYVAVLEAKIKDLDARLELHHLADVWSDAEQAAAEIQRLNGSIQALNTCAEALAVVRFFQVHGQRRVTAQFAGYPPFERDTLIEAVEAARQYRDLHQREKEDER